MHGRPSSAALQDPEIPSRNRGGKRTHLPGGRPLGGRQGVEGARALSCVRARNAALCGYTAHASSRGN
eukprot:4019833-Lingulodinium_polyedra.AAC.1